MRRDVRRDPIVAHCTRGAVERRGIVTEDDDDVVAALDVDEVRSSETGDLAHAWPDRDEGLDRRGIERPVERQVVDDGVHRTILPEAALANADRPNGAVPK